MHRFAVQCFDLQPLCGNLGPRHAAFKPILLAGASPQLGYPLLLRLIAEAGYTLVCTPYAVTFKHLDCARQVQQVASRMCAVAPRPLCAAWALASCAVLGTLKLLLLGAPHGRQGRSHAVEP